MRHKNQDACVTTEADTDDPEELEILQRLWYYPFGMSMQGLSSCTTNPDQCYRYNGKERDTLSGWTDFGARWGILEIGRWNGVDPLAASYYGWSPFCFTLDNPVRFVDPDGMAPEGSDHDYFDENGNFITSDNRGNDIRIVTDKKSFNVNSDKLAMENSVEIDGISLSENAVGRIGDHYLGVLGRSDIKAKGLSQASFIFMGVTQEDGSPEVIRGNFMYFKNPVVSISLAGATAKDGYGYVSSNLRDINNFLNTLYHETLHYNAFEPQGNGWYKDVVPVGDYWHLGHINMYNMQMMHHSWSGTTPLFKRNHDVIIRNGLMSIKNSKIQEFAKFSVNWIKNAMK